MRDVIASSVRMIIKHTCPRTSSRRDAFSLKKLRVATFFVVILILICHLFDYILIASCDNICRYVGLI